jgi:hypothetical protein
MVLYIHGKGGNAAEVEHYRKFFIDRDIIGFDYKSENVWDFKAEILNFLADKNFDKIILIANSIGAYYAMNSLADKNISQAFFISPIVNMENLITNMMRFANVTEAELREKKEIPTDFGENLSWKYLCYVRKNPVTWNVPTNILYGAKDNFTDIKIISEFAKKIGATVTIMKDGEHFFHTAAQMKFLDDWLKKFV